MKVVSKNIEYKPGHKYKIIPLGDVHLGNELFSERHFKEVVAKYADDKDAMFVLMGDVFDGVVPHGLQDKRYKPSMVDRRYAGVDRIWKAFVQDAAALLRPIADRIILALDGNHELKILERHGVDLTGMLLEELGVQADARAGYSAFIVLSFRQKHVQSTGHTQSLVVFAAHGVSTGGRTEGGFITSLGNVIRGAVRCDLFLAGHNHRAADWDNITIDVDRVRKKIVSRREVRVNTGTFLKGFTSDHRTSYAEKAMYKPNELAYYEIAVEPNHKGVRMAPTKRVFG